MKDTFKATPSRPQLDNTRQRNAFLRKQAAASQYSRQVRNYLDTKKQQERNRQYQERKRSQQKKRNYLE